MYLMKIKQEQGSVDVDCQTEQNMEGLPGVKLEDIKVEVMDEPTTETTTSDTYHQYNMPLMKIKKEECDEDYREEQNIEHDGTTTPLPYQPYVKVVDVQVEAMEELPVGTTTRDTCPLSPQPYPSRPFKCQICQKSFTRKKGLRHHILIHKEGTPFKCETCGKSFNLLAYLKTHVRIHTGEKPFECETCGMSFNRAINLKTHTRTHTGEKPFKCETCGKSFTQAQHMKRHVRTHTGERPFKCETCGKSFAQAQHLRQHVRTQTHITDRPYKCGTCGKTFTKETYLKRHVRNNTKENPFKCVTC